MKVHEQQEKGLAVELLKNVHERAHAQLNAARGERDFQTANFMSYER